MSQSMSIITNYDRTSCVRSIDIDHDSSVICLQLKFILNIAGCVCPPSNCVLPPARPNHACARPPPGGHFHHHESSPWRLLFLLFLLLLHPNGMRRISPLRILRGRDFCSPSRCQKRKCVSETPVCILLAWKISGETMISSSLARRILMP